MMYKFPTFKSICGQNSLCIYGSRWNLLHISKNENNWFQNSIPIYDEVDCFITMLEHFRLIEHLQRKKFDSKIKLLTIYQSDHNNHLKYHTKVAAVQRQIAVCFHQLPNSPVYLYSCRVSFHSTRTRWIKLITFHIQNHVQIA